MKIPPSTLLLSAVLLTGLSGCLIPRDPLPSLWFYTFSSGPANQRDSLLTPASFAEMRRDGSYTRDFGRFEYGSWDRKGQKLYFTNQQHITTAFSLNNVSLKEMQLTTGKGIAVNFESQPLSAVKASDDPFSLDNNRWRVPATHKESEAEIRHRLFNHCQFWETYFTWALKDDISTVDVRSSPTLIKIYGNGFALKPFDELPATWKSYFFDEEDCQKANAIIKDIFDHQTIAWAHTDNKYKIFIGAFQQLEQFLR